MSLWLSSFPGQLCPTFCDTYCCCIESTRNVGLALNSIGPVHCWGAGCSPLLVTSSCFLGGDAAIGNAVGKCTA